MLATPASACVACHTLCLCTYLPQPSVCVHSCHTPLCTFLPQPSACLCTFLPHPVPVYILATPLCVYSCDTTLCTCLPHPLPACLFTCLPHPSVCVHSCHTPLLVYILATPLCVHSCHTPQPASMLVSPSACLPLISTCITPYSACLMLVSPSACVYACLSFLPVLPLTLPASCLFLRLPVYMLASHFYLCYPLLCLPHACFSVCLCICLPLIFTCVTLYSACLMLVSPSACVYACLSFLPVLPLTLPTRVPACHCLCLPNVLNTFTLWVSCLLISPFWLVWFYLKVWLKMFFQILLFVPLQPRWYTSNVIQLKQQERLYTCMYVCMDGKKRRI